MAAELGTMEVVCRSRFLGSVAPLGLIAFALLVTLSAPTGYLPAAADLSDRRERR
jgi:hypothetical protein